MATPALSIHGLCNTITCNVWLHTGARASHTSISFPKNPLQIPVLPNARDPLPFMYLLVTL